MIRATLTALALAAVLAVPAGASASTSDSRLIDLAMAHNKSTLKVVNCSGLSACVDAITVNLNATNAFTLRATKRMKIVGTERCIFASADYARLGQRVMAAAGRFVDVGGSNATLTAYTAAAVRLDQAMIPVLKAC